LQYEQENNEELLKETKENYEKHQAYMKTMMESN